MKSIVLEKFVEDHEVDVYPITLSKFLMNKNKILHYFVKAEDPEFKIRGREYKVDHSECEICKTKEVDKVLCRQHTSIQRVLTAPKIMKDLDTGVLFFKNEIFKQVGDKLVVVYCPHTKLLKGDITDEKVRKINTITIQDKEAHLPDYEVVTFKSSDLLSNITKCWFNEHFSILTIPNDTSSSEWALRSNK